MKLSEPTRSWQDEKYKRLLQSDPTAFAELCERVLPELVTFLQTRFPQQDGHHLEMVAIDVLLQFRSEPEKYDPQKLSVVAYLRMAAWGDMLNLLDKNRRRDQRLIELDELSVQADENPIETYFALDEWLEQFTDLSRREVLAALEAEIDSNDKAILVLMMEGVRETERFAEVMGIAELDEVTQRREVKRAKDRLIKQLQRFGQRIGKPKS